MFHFIRPDRALFITLTVGLLIIALTMIAPSRAFAGLDTSVTNTNSSGTGSLNQAITNANAQLGVDTITFNIGAGGAQTINLTGALPALTEGALIDATTQPNCAAPCITLDGTNAGGVYGFELQSNGTTIKGFILDHFIRGVYIANGDGNIIQANHIFHSVGDGIFVENATNTLIGGSDAAHRNVIGGNGNGAIYLSGASNSGSIIQRNYLGLDASGNAMSNAGSNILITDGAHDALIGGTKSKYGNKIANSTTGSGVEIFAGTRIQIRNNRIFNNSKLAIDLGADMITANDAGDGDTGANDLQNYPIIKTGLSSTKTVTGKFESQANTQYTLDFYSNPACDGSGNGEAAKWIGTLNVTTNGSGKATYSGVIKKFAKDSYLSATATDPNGSTSEMSPCRKAK